MQETTSNKIRTDLEKLVQDGQSLGVMINNLEFEIMDGHIFGKCKDSEKPFSISVPEDCMFAHHEVDFTTTPPKITRAKTKEHISYFNLYLGIIYSEPRRTQMIEHIKAMNSPGYDIRAMGFKNTFRADSLEQPYELITNSHCVNYEWQDEVHLSHMPLMNFLNHSCNANPYTRTENTLTLSGNTIKGEARAKYGDFDSLFLADTYQFTEPTDVVFSLPCRFFLSNDRVLVIQRFLNTVKPHSSFGRIPVMRLDGNNIIMSHLLLTHQHQELPIRLFKSLLRNHDVKGLDILWDRILRFNASQLLNYVLNPIDADATYRQEFLAKAATEQLVSLLKNNSA